MAKVVSILKRKFTEEDISKIDPRMRKAMEGWSAEYTYKGQEVNIPGTWDSSVNLLKYAEVFHEPSDPFPGIFKTISGQSSSDENEIQLTLTGGWLGLDDEFIINLMILGHKAMDGTQEVEAHIHRFSGETLDIFYKGKLVTKFKEVKWWHKLFGSPRRLYYKRVKNVLEL